MVPAQPRILCVDINASSKLAVYLLERVGYEVKTSSSLADATKLVQVECFDLQLINHNAGNKIERLDQASAA
jgi:CheY-like chemotaxis protein